MTLALTVSRAGLLAIIALMPFHAFLSVWLGSMMGNQALWQSWKEIVALFALMAGAWAALRQPKLLKKLRDPLVYLAAAFLVLAIIVTLVFQPPLSGSIFGIKTDLVFLALFVLGILTGSRLFSQKLSKVLIATSAVVIAFGLLQITVLPQDFLASFGYGPTTIQPYALVDPAVEAVRIISTLGGPLQLGSFLILPLSLVAAMMLRRFRWWHPLFLAAGSIVMWHSYTRSAWIGLGIALMVIILLYLPRKWRLPLALIGTVLAAIVLELLIYQAAKPGNLQYYLFHSNIQTNGFVTSSDQHAAAINAGVDRSLSHPLGEGLGTAGPASLYTNQPFIPESHYLQIAIETGVAGLILFIMLQVWLAVRLVPSAAWSPAAAAVVAGLSGMAAVNFFLHGWADSSTALIFWAYAGVVYGSTRGKVA